MQRVTGWFGAILMFGIGFGPLALATEPAAAATVSASAAERQNSPDARSSVEIKPVRTSQAGGSAGTPPAPQVSPAVRAYIEKYNSFLRASGVERLASHRLMIASCEDCVPFIINCRQSISSVADLKDRRVRVSRSGVSLVERGGGQPKLMPGGEVKDALQNGAIDCTVGGGAPPQ